MRYVIANNNKSVQGSINLPASKSISNRVLIINALSYNPYPIHNLSESDDTRVLGQVLTSNASKFDIGHAGTAMRFLTAFLAKIVGQWELTGSARMQQRPVSVLVDALKKLGARIEYINKEGFPPLRIRGTHLKGGSLELDGSTSSQFITALLLIAPTLEGGLFLTLKNNIISGSYIKLTLELMAKFGIKYRWIKNTIEVPEQPYLPIEFTVEPDWSAASYWYEVAAFAESAEIELKNLRLPSPQGDSRIAEWFKYFGIATEASPEGLKLTKKDSAQPEKLTLDFTDNPDMAQTMVVLCVGKGVPFHFTGLETLKVKETNRIAALQIELAKSGTILTESKHGELRWDGYINSEKIQESPVINTYNDHRMALAFAPLSLTGRPLQIENPTVVTKSYPGFWDDLKVAGFQVKNI